jgi:hypothetical protein
MSSIEGVEIEIDEEAVVVTAAAPLTVLSSAVEGGGLGPARTIVNLHVHKHCPWEDVALRLDAFVARRRLPAPRVGLLTAAWTRLRWPPSGPPTSTRWSSSPWDSAT